MVTFNNFLIWVYLLGDSLLDSSLIWMWLLLLALELVGNKCASCGEKILDEDDDARTEMISSLSLLSDFKQKSRHHFVQFNRLFDRC